jgi:Xaa-Pro aminopeptidase
MTDAQAAQEQALQQQVSALEAFVAQLQEQHSKGVVTEAEVAAEILTAMVDEQIEEVAFQIHRSVSLKLTCPCPLSSEPDVEHK